MITRILETEWRVWPQMLMTAIVIGTAIVFAYA
jgi:hypothetical protein